MNNGQNICVVMLAYNAAKTLEKTYRELPFYIVDTVILVDDASADNTSAMAKMLGIDHVIAHDKNLGHGGNQKTFYQVALSVGADVVIMIHPDYQYTPKLVRAMATLITDKVFDCVLGSRILGVGAIKGGMPRHKYYANRFLSFFQNVLTGHKLSEYHTGYRAFSSEILKNLILSENSNDFIFDNQMLLQIIANNYSIGEITCPTRYAADASSIGGLAAIRYGCGVIQQSLIYRLSKMGVMKSIYS
ncbi:MAG: glycosyltransferase involved in cell wall biosynthesis [Planctomycetota bacterium]|jgi:glycosyltransferase involved in cell wall biosynthesis